jgi:hypothetical protein
MSSNPSLPFRSLEHGERFSSILLGDFSRALRWLVMGVAVAGCESRAHLMRETFPEPSMRLQWFREMVLQEPKGVVNVAITAAPDLNEGFLVADMKELQIRRYEKTGQLSGVFGGPGGGPGEFQAPVLAVLRLRDRSILAADANGSIMHFDSTGAELARSITPIRPLYGLVELDRGLVLLTGRHAEGRRATLLHEWDVASTRIRRSYFSEPDVGKNALLVATMSGGAMAAVRHDTIIVIYSLSDTAYYVNRNGSLFRKRPLRLRHFAERTADPPPPGPVTPAVQQWANSFSRTYQPFILSDGTLVVSYYRTEGVTPIWSVFAETPRGEILLDDDNSPQLLAVVQDTLVFVKPDATAPNVWSLARLSR